MDNGSTRRPDPAALLVARQVHEGVPAAVTVLFGSRARGDYRPDSDIDILLVADDLPEPELRAAAKALAADGARHRYQPPVPCQVIWKTTAEVSRMRRTINHMIARAFDEGVVMPRDPSQYDAECDDDGMTDYEWSVTDERIRHAEQHLYTFCQLADLAQYNFPDRVIGKNAQEAMEHALKAHISAAGVRYERTHNLHILLRQVQDADPQFGFTPQSDYDVLNDYAGSSDYYEPEHYITEQPDYRARVEADVRALLARVAVIRPQS